MEEFMRYSRITGQKYNIFECIRILNLEQCMFYIENDVLPVDIGVSQSRKTGKPCFVFMFVKADTREVYDQWCKRKESRDEL